MTISKGIRTRRVDEREALPSLHIPVAIPPSEIETVHKQNKKLAAAVISLALKDIFKPHHQVETHQFLIGNRGLHWFDVLGLEPMKGTLNEVRLQISNNDSEKKKLNALKYTPAITADPLLFAGTVMTKAVYEKKIRNYGTDDKKKKQYLARELCLVVPFRKRNGQKKVIAATRGEIRAWADVSRITIQTMRAAEDAMLRYVEHLTKLERYDREGH